MSNLAVIAGVTAHGVHIYHYDEIPRQAGR